MRKTGTRMPPMRRGTTLQQPYLAHDPESPAAPQKALKRKKAGHFLSPFRLSEQTRTQLLAELEARAIGDVGSRDLFAAALEYGVARCRSRTQPPVPLTGEPAESADTSAPPPACWVPTETSSVQGLIEHAQALAQRLSELDPATRAALCDSLTASDPCGRTHDLIFLDALAVEAKRLARAASSLPCPPVQQHALTLSAAPAIASRSAPPQTDRGRGLDPAGRCLIDEVRAAFEACFDTRLDAARAAILLPLLRLIGADAAIRFKVDDTFILAACQDAPSPPQPD
ncbi:hypothetical protein CKO25_08695 [Thiocapsa imhoffii]|uniref:Uncharacterized protein n=1 Tax=Thiocapsa imhoffii TaxID=382777 RepID=A0A9X0WHJ4_9GAMM|nr:hypothetical protein [Thiocapsa imhoffii]MBK1644723.1 hypothetical protein [Thiocapsa imhoffii]